MGPKKQTRREKEAVGLASLCNHTADGRQSARFVLDSILTAAATATARVTGGASRRCDVLWPVLFCTGYSSYSL